jgi:sigma-B regulation protein RsbU (phosphoserine phosphatase)
LSIAPAVASMAAAACPLRTTADEVDVLYVSLPPECGTAEWLALVSLAAEQYQVAEEAWAARAAAADHAALERELAKAMQIQRRLVPDGRSLATCRETGIDAAVGFLPCREVGGDYVDVVPTGDGRALAVVADVSGHGLAAALVSSTVHALVRASARGGQDLQVLADGLNRHLCETLPGDTFVTFVAALIDPGDARVRFMNAGHPPALVVGVDGAVRRVVCGQNLPLGLDATAPLEGCEAQLEPGEVLLLYTDGLIEQPDEAGMALGIHGLVEALGEAWREASGEVTGVGMALEGALARRQGSRARDDDQSFLLAARRQDL